MIHALGRLLTTKKSAMDRDQPWKRWYVPVGEVKIGCHFVWPTLLAGNGPGNGADQVLSLGVDLTKPKEESPVAEQAAKEQSHGL